MRKKDKEEINNFFIKSIDSQFGKSVQKYYDKKYKLSNLYAQILKATPDNMYSLRQIALSFILNNKEYSNLKQTAAHIDDEIHNLAEDFKCNDSEDKDMCIYENKNKIQKYLDEKLLKLNINFENIENSCSIGFCLGNFLCCYKSFREEPIISKAISLASLTLACGLHIIKLIPNVKVIIKT